MPTILVNGQITPSHHPCIKYNDRGFTLGHGLFETILMHHGIIPAFDFHWHRLEMSAPLIGITLPFSKHDLMDMLHTLMKENRLQQTIAAARITVTHGESSRGLWPTTEIAPNVVISAFKYSPPATTDFSAVIVSARKNEHAITSRIKSISYLDNILAKQEALSQGFDEAILLNISSNVADGAMTTLFIVKHSRVYTPPVTDGALPGVLRQIILDQLSSEFSIVEQSFSATELLEADEIFVTNALIGVQSVTQINNKKKAHFDVSQAIAKRLRKMGYTI